MMSKVITIFRWSLVAVMIAAPALLMLNAARNDSAIVDELAHIPAGYAYLRYQDYRLNPEHPPLVKMLAAIPLLFQNLNFPLNISSWIQDVNSQWEVGNQFLYGSGNDADKIIFLARIGPIILTLILILAIYFLAKELIGRWWALLPAFLFAFSPTALAHGHYVATDTGAALGVFLSIWTFLNFLLRPTGKKLILAGLAFGFAQSVKFSSALLIPYFIILLLLFSLAGLWRDGGKRVFYYWKSLFFIFLIGLGTVYTVYLFAVWNYPVDRQISDTESILQTFQLRFLANLDIWMAGSPIFRPLAEYFLGLLMVLQRSAGGNVVYFLGEVSNGGIWSYFPIAFLLKEPAGSLLLILMALFFGFWNFCKSFLSALFGKGRRLYEYLNTYFPEFAMAGFVLFYWIYSINSNLNIGLRHILPTAPLIYILTASAVKNWFSINDLSLARNFIVKILIVYNELATLSVKSAVLIILLLWYFLSSLITAPHFLSYFNFLGGGLKNGYRQIVDSNYDWGQDLKRLAQWANENEIEKIAVDYFGGGNPRYYLSERAIPWWSARGTPKIENIKWLAVSINTIQNAKGKTVAGFERKPQDEYQWLIEPHKPYARAGTSIFIYKLE